MWKDWLKPVWNKLLAVCSIWVVTEERLSNHGFTGRSLSDERRNYEKMTLKTKTKKNNPKNKKQSVNLTQNFSASQKALFFFFHSHSETDQGIYCHLISDFF